MAKRKGQRKCGCRKSLRNQSRGKMRGCLGLRERRKGRRRQCNGRRQIEETEQRGFLSSVQVTRPGLPSFHTGIHVGRGLRSCEVFPKSPWVLNHSKLEIICETLFAVRKQKCPLRAEGGFSCFWLRWLCVPDFPKPKNPPRACKPTDSISLPWGIPFSGNLCFP